MSRNIYYFNPENDLALANGGLNYTAPPRATQLRHDLRLLPAWLATAGDLVLCDDRCDHDWLSAQGLEVDIVTPAELGRLTDARLVPWGWSRATRRTLQHLGAPAALLPDAERIEAVHRLSHRRTTIAMHQQLGTPRDLIPVELTSVQAVKQWAATHPGCYVKLPWSGSGQGVYHVLNLDDEHLWRWCAGGLRRQGSLLCEVGFDKVQDFATEWLCHDGTARLVGYSVFASDFHHQYQYGYVASQQALHDLLVGLCPDIDTAVAALREAITTTMACNYDGYLGVDMMLYRDHAGSLAVNACVEVNLRCTMGLVCCALGERHGLRGTFHVTDAPLPGDHLLTPSGHFAAVLRAAD